MEKGWEGCIKGQRRREGRIKGDKKEEEGGITCGKEVIGGRNKERGDQECRGGRRRDQWGKRKVWIKGEEVEGKGRWREHRWIEWENKG